LSAFAVLVLWGFELDETSIVADVKEASPSTVGGAVAAADAAEAVWGSAVERVLFRGMVVCV
jgi:hypothetical protein